MLDGAHPAGSEAAAITDALDIVDDLSLGIAREQEVAMQRMNWPVFFYGNAAATRAWPSTKPP